MNTITCHNCQARLAVPDPVITILNNPDKCVVIMDPVRVRCSNPLCGKEYVSAIQAVNINLGWPQAPPEQGNRQIIVPNLVMPKNLKG